MRTEAELRRLGMLSFQAAAIQKVVERTGASDEAVRLVAMAMGEIQATVKCYTDALTAYDQDKVSPVQAKIARLEGAIHEHFAKLSSGMEIQAREWIGVPRTYH